ncbi:hypothetical protein MTBBW1_260002 [Desulfamplus magnetovallimortis]|uniref:Solute-binding protein family 3/N-terminal domain-containing protein n=1 Tax=Desulfamplus magnetovallimortis TaxID=1246637 RepID=A0A1W1HES4_9BACT|nr:hypothetical protein MTBBW1_260002 [Desulfamplus magnetovallimortis]
MSYHSENLRLTRSSFILNQNEVYYGFSKKTVSPELLSRLQKAFNSAKAEGKFEAVINRYK